MSIAHVNSDYSNGSRKSKLTRGLAKAVVSGDSPSGDDGYFYFICRIILLFAVDQLLITGNRIIFSAP